MNPGPAPLLLLPAALLAACSPADREATNRASPEAASVAPPPEQRPAPPPKDVEIEERTDTYVITAHWPGAAEAIAPLATQLRGEVDALRKDMLPAAEDKAMREREGWDFHPYEGGFTYEVAGQTPRLLSLAGSWNQYTGGAHPMHGARHVLWDLAANRAIGIADLFAAPGGWERLLERPWCTALDAERADRRGGEIVEMFSDCPKLADIDVAPVDRDGDGRFERLAITADPYVAGPYAEGDYDVELPVTAAIVAALRPVYRDSFAAQPPQ